MPDEFLQLPRAERSEILTFASQALGKSYVVLEMDRSENRTNVGGTKIDTVLQEMNI